MRATKSPERIKRVRRSDLRQPTAARAMPSGKSTVSPVTPGRTLGTPIKSIAKAKVAFRNFNLSKFASTSTPPNYVASGENAATAQIRVISQSIDNPSAVETSNRAMTVALTNADITQLPSFDPKKGTVDLSDLMNWIQKSMSGTEFYARGNPILNRLSVQLAADQIINDIKGGAK